MFADARFWDNLAERYAQKPIDNLPAYHGKLAATKARLNPHDLVLDIGCGTGSLALELAPHVAHVHAVDLSREMVKIGERKAQDQGVSNVTFHVGTLDALASFEPGSFNAVCAYNILHLVQNRAAMLQRIAELLGPQGFFVSTTPCLGESKVPYKLILPIMRWLGKAPSVQVIDIDHLENGLREAGFVDLTRPDVGAASHTAFVLASTPA